MGHQLGACAVVKSQVNSSNQVQVNSSNQAEVDRR